MDVHTLPSWPIGENSNSSHLRELCPQRDYRKCFVRATKLRYNVSELQFVPPRGQDAAHAAASVFPGCSSSHPVRRGHLDSLHSFSASALQPTEHVLHRAPHPGRIKRLAMRLEQAAKSRQAALPGSLGCDSSVSALGQQLVLLLGVPSRGGDMLAATRRRAPLPESCAGLSGGSRNFRARSFSRRAGS